MYVYYKFNAACEYDTLAIDGLHISLADLKASINHQKRLGKGDVCDLLVTNALTEQKYEDEKDLIPKNSSLIIARIPVDSSKRRFWDSSKENKELLLMNPEYRMNVCNSNANRTEGLEEAELMRRRIEEAPDLTKFRGTEEEKIATMMAQSTIDYHPTTYLKLRNTAMTGEIPHFYKCYKCHQKGHWVSNCPLNNSDIKKCTGIPSKFLIEITDPKTPGAMITPAGKYVIFNQAMVEDAKAQVESKYIAPPPSLICPICDQMLKDAVLISCCAKAYCDDCIRTHLLEDDDQTCPSCKQTGVTPSTLIPSVYLRQQTNNYGMTLVPVPGMLPNENETPAKITRNTPPIVANASPRVMTPEISKFEEVAKDEVGSEKVHEDVQNISHDNAHSHKSKKKKKEKKSKKEKKAKKDKKEKKRPKTEAEEYVINPKFDPAIPPPNLGLQSSANIYDGISRLGGVLLYTGVVEDPLAKFEEYLKLKDAKKHIEQKLRSLSPRSQYRHRTSSRSDVVCYLNTVREVSPLFDGRSGSVERKKRLSPRRSYGDRSSSSGSSSSRYGQPPHSLGSQLDYPQTTGYQIPTVTGYRHAVAPQYAQRYSPYGQYTRYNPQRPSYYDRNYSRPDGEEYYLGQNWDHSRDRVIRSHSDYRHNGDRRFDSSDYRGDRKESPDRKRDCGNSPDGYYRSRKKYRRRNKRDQEYSNPRDDEYVDSKETRRSEISSREHASRELEHMRHINHRNPEPHKESHRNEVGEISPRERHHEKEIGQIISSERHHSFEQTSPEERHHSCNKISPRVRHHSFEQTRHREMHYTCDKISPRERNGNFEKIIPGERHRSFEKISPRERHRSYGKISPREVHGRKEYDDITTREVHQRIKYSSISPKEIHQRIELEPISPRGVHQRNEEQQICSMNGHLRRDYMNSREIYPRKGLDCIPPVHHRKKGLNIHQRPTLQHNRYDSETCLGQRLLKFARQNEIEARTGNVKGRYRPARLSESESYLQHSPDVRLPHSRSRSRSLTPDDLRKKLKKRKLVLVDRKSSRQDFSYETDLDKSRSSDDEHHLVNKPMNTPFSDRTSSISLERFKKRTRGAIEDTRDDVQIKTGAFEVIDYERKKHDKKKKKREKRELSEVFDEMNGGERRKKKNKNKVEQREEATDQSNPEADNTKKECHYPFLPKPSKWENFEYNENSPLRCRKLSKNETVENLVTSDVLKRAERAIFHKKNVTKRLVSDTRFDEISSSSDDSDTSSN